MATTIRLLLLALLLAACGDDGNGDASPSTTTPSTTTAAPGTTTEPEPTSTTAPAVPACADEAPASHQQSAECVQAALSAENLAAAENYATPEALDALAPLSSDSEAAEWTFDGCDDDPLVTAPTSGIVCSFYIPGEVHGVEVELAMRDDYVVESVETIG